MPFCRIVRDTRGYEYLSLIQQTSGRRGKVRQQLLYWYRTPPNIKVGRQALDEDVKRALEARNPDVQFDWDALRDTPPLMPSVEPWRERRRAERAARQLRDADEETEAPRAEPEPAASQPAIDVQGPLEDESGVESSAGDTVRGPVAAETLTDVSDSKAVAVSVRRRRHRRRGRRGPAQGASDPSGPAAVPTEDAPSSSTDYEQPESPDEDE